MSDTIQKRIGPLAGRIRSFLTDSMELEGSNWTDSMADRFKERYGYDLMPYLPLMLWKTHRLGDVWEYSYGAQKSPELQGGDRSRALRFRDAEGRNARRVLHADLLQMVQRPGERNRKARPTAAASSRSRAACTTTFPGGRPGRPTTSSTASAKRCPTTTTAGAAAT